MRKIIISCYTHHGRIDLLQAFNQKSTDQDVSNDTATQQLQLQLQHGIDLASLQDNVVSTSDGLGVSSAHVSTYCFFSLFMFWLYCALGYN